MKVGSLPRNIPQQAGQRSMPTTDFSVNEMAKPKPKSDLNELRQHTDRTLTRRII